MKKHIYFVRHGETDANVVDMRQGPESALSVEGLQQAAFVARRFDHIIIDTIIASPFVRTKQTAEVVHQYIGKPLEYSELFRERKNPSEIIGLKTGDPKGDEVTRLILKNHHTPGWRYSDEENFDDLKQRAGEAMLFLQERPENNILVVSHGLFMRTFLARVIFGEDMTSHEFVKTVYSHSVKNTGITLYEYDSDRVGWETKGWLLKTWNDHAHLG
jgi:broad specificity phosphatase PhoE